MSGQDEVTTSLNGQRPSSTRANQQSSGQPFGDHEVVLLTNDDGLDPGSAMVLDFAQEMVARGYQVVVCAPGSNNSACGQKISIQKTMQLQRHADLEEQYGGDVHAQDRLMVYSLDKGTPSDCVIVATEAYSGLLAHLNMKPIIVLSGVNVGPNLGPDILYSGTFAAARQAAMYGIPGFAASLDATGDRKTDANYDKACHNAVRASADLAEMLIQVVRRHPTDVGRLKYKQDQPVCTTPSDQSLAAAFAAGNVLVNLNVPSQWNGEFAQSGLDSILYRGAVHFSAGVPQRSRCEAEAISVSIAGGIPEVYGSNNSDTQVLKLGCAAVSTLSTWPATHPWAVRSSLLAIDSKDAQTAALPFWLRAMTPSHD